ncbi:hypothetical protein LTR27_007323 [Elasticomyces elasticus]|nr:hypothetical protein LTR27_007323 [Elasticomyces elasticus]
MRPSFFVGACEGQFKEATENVVTLHEDEAEVVDAMLRYMYTNDYYDDCSDMDPRVFNVRMVAVAEKYFVDNLTRFAVRKLRDQVNKEEGSDGWAEAIEVAYAISADSSHELSDVLFDFVIGGLHDLLNTEKPDRTRRLSGYGGKDTAICS